MIRLAAPASAFRARDGQGVARVQAGGGGVTAVPGAPVAEPSSSTMGPTLSDFAVLLAAVLLVVAVGWSIVRWARKSPTRGLRAAVRRARQVNERFDGVSVPHPVPEMEARRRQASAVGPELEAAVGTAYNVSAASDDARPKAEDATARAALERLARLQANPDGKDIRGDYARLDALVRRYLFDRYGVRAFSSSATELLGALPQELTDSVVDYAGEILRVCEVAQLRGHRASRGELRHLVGLAYELVSGHDGADYEDDHGTDIPE